MEKFKILSLDGGGVRGYLTAIFLKKIEEHLDHKTGEKIPLGLRFDLIAGTSTGGIIAGLLSIGKSASEILEMYEADIPLIFGPLMRKNTVSSTWAPKYSSTSLSQKAEEYFTDSSTTAPYTFADVKTDLLITSVDLTTAKPRFHKSDYMLRNRSRIDEKLSDAILGSTAAPTYFQAAKSKYAEALIDGGIAANNPSLIAMIDALQFERSSKRGTSKPNSISETLLLSIGTGQIGEVPYDVDKLKNGGKFQWAKPISDILMESQSQLAAYQTNFLYQLHNASYLRINPQLMTKMQLDDATSFNRLKSIADLDQAQFNFINQNF